MLTTLLSNQTSTATKTWLKVSGVWKLCTVYIKVGGVWKVSTPKIKVTGTWK